jgi:hypothetical protein
VNNGWSRLIVLSLGDPHLLEGGEGGKDGATDPDGVLTLWRSDDLDLHGGRSKVGDLLLHAVSDTREHSGSTGEDGVSVEVLTDIDVALHDGVVSALVDTGLLHAEEGWLEESLWATESLVTDGDDLTVRKFVGLLEGRGGSSGLHLLLEVKSDIAELLLDVTDDFTLSGGGESVTTLSEDLHEVVSKITTSKIETEDSVWKSITFVDWDGVGNTITGVEDDTGGTARGVEGKDSLDSDVHGWGVESLKHDLSHFLTVSLWVEWGLSEENRVFLRSNTKLIVEGVVPDLLHIVPVSDDTVLDWVLEGQDTTLGLSLITDVGVLLTHTDHNTLVAWATNDGRKHGAWCIITSKTGLAHTGSVIDNECCNFVFHDVG